MKIQLKHLLIVFTGFVLLLGLASIFLIPLVRLSGAVNADQQRIKYDLDLAAILESSTSLLTDSSNRLVDPVDQPDAISQTKPKSVYINNGEVHIEYGSGFGHYGLIVDPNNMHRANELSQSGGGYYSEELLIEHVYYYETE